MRRLYTPWPNRLQAPSTDHAAIIYQADQICSQYAAAGDGLTLRQLYYQFVSRGLIENSQKSYKRLGSIVNDARAAGLINWRHLADRTRNASVPHVGPPDDPAEIMRSASYGYILDRWEGQEVRVEVWVEKEALGEVVSRAAGALRCGSLACKGYMSASEMWEASQRFGDYLQGGQRVVILHLGDHDPSGIDMTRDIRDRLTTFIQGDWAHDSYGQPAHEMGWDTEMFDEAIADDYGLTGAPLTVERIALNWDQIEAYNPPPNPAKLTDSRGTKYVEEYGTESWELDALPPDVLRSLIDTHIREYLDVDKYNEQIRRQQEVRAAMDEAADEIAERFGQQSDEDDD